MQTEPTVLTEGKGGTFDQKGAANRLYALAQRPNRNVLRFPKRFSIPLCPETYGAGRAKCAAPIVWRCEHESCTLQKNVAPFSFALVLRCTGKLLYLFVVFFCL